MPTGYLLDEHVTLMIQERLQEMTADLRVYVVGGDAAPPKSTPDPDLLVWIEAHDCFLFTNNRSSMPVHLADHLASGRHVPGVVQLPTYFDVRTILDDLLLIWSAGSPEEFQDQIRYLPL